MTITKKTSAISLIAIMLLLLSCQKNKLPVLTTVAVTNITISSAVSGGVLTDEGSGNIVSLGVCWSTDQEPTIQDFKTSEMAGVQQFSSEMKGLFPGKKYYVRAYAVNDAGIGYGNEVSFTTL